MPFMVAAPSHRHRNSMVDYLTIAVYLVPVDKPAHNHRLIRLPPLGKRAGAHHGDDE